ncbi:MAG: hypothetical protein ACYDEV_02620 [Acidiferrobacter sp.]
MLSVEYTRHNRFAVAQYTFPSFHNVRQVRDIITMVAYKYGKPSSLRGNLGHGPVTARWEEGGGTEIKVWRGWPSTSTYMALENIANVKRMRTEMPAFAHESDPAQGDISPIMGQKQWEPQSPSELVAPGVNKAIPMMREVAIVLLFSIPALFIVIFAHFFARVTRIPPTFKVAAYVFFAKIAQWFRKPAWKRRRG